MGRIRGEGEYIVKRAKDGITVAVCRDSPGLSATQVFANDILFNKCQQIRVSEIDDELLTAATTTGIRLTANACLDLGIYFMNMGSSGNHMYATSAGLTYSIIRQFCTVVYALDSGSTPNTYMGNIVSAGANYSGPYNEANEYLWTTAFGLGITTPAVPSTGSGQVNSHPFKVRIYILTANAGATFTITDTLTNTSASIPITAGNEITLNPGCTITPTYTTLTWKWYGTT